MTEATEDRIHRLLLTLSVHAPQLDLTQIGNFLRDLAAQAEGDERKRVAELVRIAHRRITQFKGSCWRRELDELEKDIDRGTQRLFQI
jgi:hypothetical protein